MGSAKKSFVWTQMSNDSIDRHNTEINIVSVVCSDSDIQFTTTGSTADCFKLVRFRTNQQ